MSTSIFSDDALQAASLALKGLSARQEVIGNNIANVDTPGYNAQQIDFETTLARTLNQSTTKVGMAKTSEFHLDSSTTNSEFLANLIGKEEHIGKMEIMLILIPN